MIEIIEHGKKRYTFSCDSCGCKFVTDGAEIFREKRIHGNAWIYCPECGAQILVEPEKNESGIMDNFIPCKFNADTMQWDIIKEEENE